jgi:hypothetical protein
MESNGASRHAGLIALSLLFAAGCGSNPVSVTSDGRSTEAGRTDGRSKEAGRTDGAARDVRPGIDGRSDGPASKLCPAQLPVSGVPCGNEGLVCEYGDNPRCLSRATCSQGQWTTISAKCQPPDPSCPATREAAAGQICQQLNAYCNYSGLVCDCTNCVAYPIPHCSGPLTWHCDSPSPDPACPAARPLLGAACFKEAQLCEYGCETDVSRRCTGGVWVAASSPGGCPISTRAAKRDIRYLTESDRAQMAEEAQRLRLATYRYRDPAMDGRRHLGFIIEDSPRSLAADLEKRQVDLYSFTSLVLALAQQQQKEIEHLRRQVEVLRHDVTRPAARAGRR